MQGPTKIATFLIILGHACAAAGTLWHVSPHRRNGQSSQARGHASTCTDLSDSVTRFRHLPVLSKHWILWIEKEKKKFFSCWQFCRTDLKFEKKLKLNMCLNFMFFKSGFDLFSGLTMSRYHVESPRLLKMQPIKLYYGFYSGL